MLVDQCLPGAIQGQEGINSADFDTAYAHAITTDPEPESVHEAINSPEKEQWLEALKAELRALIKNGTFRKADRNQHCCVKALKHNAVQHYQQVRVHPEQG